MVAEISLSGVVLVLNTYHDVMVGVLVINLTCKDKRYTGNHDITKI